MEIVLDNKEVEFLYNVSSTAPKCLVIRRRCLKIKHFINSFLSRATRATPFAINRKNLSGKLRESLRTTTIVVNYRVYVYLSYLGETGQTS